MRSLDAEVIRQFVTDEGPKQTIDIDTPRLVFPEDIAKFRTSYRLSTRKIVPIGKDIFSFGSSSLVLSFVCILADSNITKDAFILVNGKLGVDLSRNGETIYRDRGYFGSKPNASMDKTMKRATRNHPLSIKDKRRNMAISRVRSLVERPFEVIKSVFHAGHVMVTTVARANVKCMFTCFSYDLYRLSTLLQFE